MALIGSNFRQYVVDQIRIRQKQFGSGYQTKGQPHPSYEGIKNKKAIFESTPWMRLSSGVKITIGADSMPGTSVYEQILSTGLLDGIDEARWAGSGLARKCVLQGTPNSVTGQRKVVGVVGVPNPNAIPGVNGGTTPYPEQLTKAYGWGYNSTGVNNERGYVPPPGVTSVDFEYKNDGALAQAKVNIKCFSKEQFAIIDILYMRPGYTVLLEFGHTVYENNAGETVYVDTAHTLPKNVLFSTGTAPSPKRLSAALLKEKEKWQGNYEGFYARITKFGWKFNNDGSYDITINLTGVGDVISSLNVMGAKSFSTPFSIDSKFEIKPEKADAEIESVKEDSTFDDDTWYGWALNTVIDATVGLVETGIDSYNYVNDEVINGSQTLSDEEIKKASEEGAVVIANAFKSQLNFDLYTIFADKSLFNTSKAWGLAIEDASAFGLPLKKVPINGKPTNFTINHGVIKFDVFEKGSDPEYSPTTLITFGGFLAMLQRVCNVEDGKGGYALEFELVNNLFNKKQRDYMVTYPGNFSCDPNKVLIHYKDFNKNDFASFPGNADDKVRGDIELMFGLPPGSTMNLPSIPTDTIMNKIMANSNKGKVFSPERFSNSDLVYPLANVYVNINMIAGLINSLGTENEEEQLQIPVLALVDGVLNEINNCCGGINEFRTIYNEDMGMIQILSESPVLMLKRPKSTVINTFGFQTDKGYSEGSFVKSMDLNSELSDAFATQIAIGAQANGNTMSGGSAAFSAYSKGLIDNTFTEKKSTLEKESKSSEEKDSISTQISKIYEESKLEESFKQVYDERNFDEAEDIDVLKNTGSQISSLIINQYFQTKTGPAPFFLPFNMSLTMKGLGGLRIYDGFKIDGKALPLSYNPKDIKLVIKSLSHSITPESWDTKISTISTVDSSDVTPRPYQAVDKSKSEGSPSSSGGGGGGGGGQVSGNKLPPPPGDKPLEDEKLRVILTRIFDNGDQTLGIMDVLAKDEKTILYSLATVELPWKGNQNSISCIPVDLYSVKSNISPSQGKGFLVNKNKAGNWAPNKLYGNNFIRSNVLIHKAPKTGRTADKPWLKGCIGPGLTFNTIDNQKFGAYQQGIGSSYLNPAKAESIKAVQKLIDTLYSEGSFKMKIVNQGNVGYDKLPKTWNDSLVGSKRQLLNKK